MNIPRHNSISSPFAQRSNSGAILVIVMWIAFGLISLALYFGHSMSFELRAADNRVAGAEAEQAIEGAARYLTLVLSNNIGYMPDPQAYQCEEVPVGNAAFWIIGRGDNANASTATTPTFGLIDEASKLNLNTAALTNLEMLPQMTMDIAASILYWQGKTNNPDATGGATDPVYSALKPPYSLKGSNFESVAELRLVYGVTMDILYGEDANLNGILDPNENDGETNPPYDNRDGRLDPGLIEYLTVYTSDPNLDTNGSPRVDINDAGALGTLLTNQFTASKAQQIRQAAQGAGRFTSVAQFYSRVQNVLTSSEFEQIADSIAVNTNSPLRGQVNVNTASEIVLASLEGFTTDIASQLVSYRRSNPSNLRTVAWIASVLGTNIPPGAGVLTTHSYQFTADIAAVGHHDRGYRRVRFVFDTSTGIPQIIYRQDLSRLGWALGRDIREQMLTAKETR